MKQEGLVLIKSVTGADDSDGKAKPKKKFTLRTFLLWTNLMKTSTKFKDDGKTETEDRWNVGLITLIALLYVTVIGGFIVLAVGGAVFYLDTREDQRGNDAWKQKELYNNWQKTRNECLENAERLRGLILYSQQNKQEVPPQFLNIKTCGEAEVINKQK